MQGPPGVGKTHLAVSLGVRAVELGFGVAFYRLEDLLAALKRHADLPTSRLRSKKYLSSSLIIIDEVGFEPMSRQAPRRSLAPLPRLRRSLQPSGIAPERPRPQRMHGQQLLDHAQARVQNGRHFACDKQFVHDALAQKARCQGGPVTVDWDALARAQSLIKPEPLAGDFMVIVQRLGHVDLATRFKSGEEVNPAIRRALGNFRPLTGDFSSLLTLAYRLERDLEERDADRLDDFSWFAFSRLDVEMFFSKFRSLFDHLGGVAQALAVAPDSTSKSFNALRKVAVSETRSEELPRRIRELVAECAWFEDLRDWRDSLIHDGGYILTFKDSGQLPFQLYVTQRADGLQLPDLMMDDNVIDFRLLGAAYLSRLLVLLDDLAQVLMEMFAIADTRTDPRTANAGIHYLVGWFEQLAQSRPQPTQ